MIKFLFNIIIIILVTLISERIAYNHIRSIDKKERAKLQEWEMEHLKKLKEMDLIK